MEAAVLDTSITMAWCFDDEATPYTEELLNWCAAGTAIHVASIWPMEVTNVLLNAQRKARVTEDRIQEFLDVLFRLPIHIDPVLMKRAVYDIRKLAQAYRLTSYDAAYLELALREHLPLASLDSDLKKAAAASGVRLIKP
jgi:predicted nucleic acid-binding protein